jgi:hypothetical protein
MFVVFDGAIETPFPDSLMMVGPSREPYRPVTFAQKATDWGELFPCGPQLHAFSRITAADRSPVTITIQIKLKVRWPKTGPETYGRCQELGTKPATTERTYRAYWISALSFLSRLLAEVFPIV